MRETVEMKRSADEEQTSPTTEPVNDTPVGTPQGKPEDSQRGDDGVATKKVDVSSWTTAEPRPKKKWWKSKQGASGSNKDAQKRTDAGQLKTKKDKSGLSKANLWVKAREKLLVKLTKGTIDQTVWEDEIKYAKEYKCARSDKYALVEDGYQRLMTELEEKTLFLWCVRKIHLAEPPLFLTETHTLRERNQFLKLHREEMGFRIYVETPPGFCLPVDSAKWHFYNALLTRNQTEGSPTEQITKLFSDVWLIKCSPTSRFVELVFLRPEIPSSRRTSPRILTRRPYQVRLLGPPDLSH